MIALKITRPTPNDPFTATTRKVHHPLDWKTALRLGFEALADGAQSFTASIEDEHGYLIRALTYYHDGVTILRKGKDNA